MARNAPKVKDASAAAVPDSDRVLHQQVKCQIHLQPGNHVLIVQWPTTLPDLHLMLQGYALSNPDSTVGNIHLRPVMADGVIGAVQHWPRPGLGVTIHDLVNALAVDPTYLPPCERVLDAMAGLKFDDMAPEHFAVYQMVRVREKGDLDKACEIGEPLAVQAQRVRAASAANLKLHPHQIELSDEMKRMHKPQMFVAYADTDRYTATDMPGKFPGGQGALSAHTDWCAGIAYYKGRITDVVVGESVVGRSKRAAKVIARAVLGVHLHAEQEERVEVYELGDGEVVNIKLSRQGLNNLQDTAAWSHLYCSGGVVFKLENRKYRAELHRIPTPGLAEYVLRLTNVLNA